MEKAYPERGLPVVRPKEEEDTDQYPGGAGAQYHPGAGGGAEPRFVAGGRPLVARLPKFSGTTQLEPYLAQFHLAAVHYGWNGNEAATQLALSLEGTAVQVLLDLAPADQRNLQALTQALERRYGQRAVVCHSREQLTSRRRQEGERLGAYAADVQLYAQRGYPTYPAAVREDLALSAFLRGLSPPQLGRHVRLTRPPTLGAALHEAEQAEAEFVTQPSPQPSGAPQPHVRRVDYEERDDEGAEASQAWASPRPPRSRPPPPDRGEAGADRRCFRCRELGHLARDCPAPAPRARPPRPAENYGGVAQ